MKRESAKSCIFRTPNNQVMATTSKKPAAPKATAKSAAASRAKPASQRPAKSRIVPGLYQGRLLIAPDFFEPHETPPGLERKAA